MSICHKKMNCKKIILVATIFERIRLLSPFIFMLSSNSYFETFVSYFINIWALLMQVVVMIVYTYVFQMLAPPITTCSHIMDFETHGELVALTMQRIDYYKIVFLHLDYIEEDFFSLFQCQFQDPQLQYTWYKKTSIFLESSPLLSNLKYL